ncbi:hypothetical protein J1N35_029827 [Gossypium stocksii]|uniref:Uncharacterized protein n=1 Tax=Gossypium stocksii TaxID=47602 RepID=A0A9D3ZTU0_9ROSI|nr:hypothetical protein J1N35_029827 [Gossypium stocksii]
MHAPLGLEDIAQLVELRSYNWVVAITDAEIHLDAKGLGNNILADKEASNQDKAKAMIFIHHHLYEGLKVEYLTVKDPLELWKNLKERFNHQKTVILPKAHYDWMHLRLQDFKTVSEYNSELFKISSQLKLCGENITDENLLEKIFSTFHATNVLLQQQYREKGFKRYSELILCLLVAEQNNELLMKNYGIRPTGSAPFSEVNVAVHNNYENRKYRSRGRGHGRSGGRGRERISNRYHGDSNNDISNHQKKNNNER